MLKNKRLKMLLLIFLISIIPRILFIGSVLKVEDGNVVRLVNMNDGARYCIRAAGLARKLPISRLRHNLLCDVPLYPMFLSIFFKMFSPNYLLAIFLNIILFGLSSCLLYMIGVLLLGNKAGLYATIIYSFFPTLFIYSICPVTEPLFLVLFLSAFYSFILFLRSDRNKYLILTASLLGLSTLTKEVMFFFTIPIVAFIVPIYTKHWKQAVKTISLLIVIYMAVLSPPMMYNYHTLGHFVISGKIVNYTNSKTFNKLKSGIFNLVTFNKREASLQKKNSLFLNIRNYFYDRKHFFGSTGTTVLMRALGYNVSELRATSYSPKLFLATLKKNGMGMDYLSILYIVFCWLCIYL